MVEGSVQRHSGESGNYLEIYRIDGRSISYFVDGTGFRKKFIGLSHPMFGQMIGAEYNESKVILDHPESLTLDEARENLLKFHSKNKKMIEKRLGIGALCMWNKLLQGEE